MSTIEMTVNSINTYRTNCTDPEKVKLLNLLEELWMCKIHDHIKLDALCCLESHDKLNTYIPFMQTSVANFFTVLTAYNGIPRFTIRDGHTNILQGVDFSKITNLKVVKFDPDENTPNQTTHEITFNYLGTVDYRLSLTIENE